MTGSSTVEPISVLVAELADEQSGGELAVTVEGPGTGDGFTKFCDGEADIADASRNQGRRGRSVYRGRYRIRRTGGRDRRLDRRDEPDNTAVECLDVPALYALLGPESEGFAKWSDAQALATELGSTATLPDAPTGTLPALASRAEPTTRWSSSSPRVLPKIVNRMTSSAATTPPALTTT